MKKISLLLLSLITLCCIQSCKSLTNFINQDVEEEDFIIGELYADEYVEEKPFVPAKTLPKGSGGKMGIVAGPNDNKKLYNEIESWYGTPYLYGGCSKSGVDCSCFVGNIYKSVYGITLKRTARDMQAASSPVSKSKLKEGDLVFFTNSNGKVSHVGIYLREDMFAHASTSRGVMISRLTDTYWAKNFYKGGRVK